MKNKGLIPVPDRNDRGDKLLFWLSPNDLVYLPTEEEREFGRINEPIDRGRIYKIVALQEVVCMESLVMLLM